MSLGATKLLALGRGCCVWPIGDPALDSFRWCGESEMPGKSYCAKHAARAYTSDSACSEVEAITEHSLSIDVDDKLLDRSAIGVIAERCDDRSEADATTERSGGRTYRVELARGRGLGDKRQIRVVPVSAQKPVRRSPDGVNAESYLGHRKGRRDAPRTRAAGR
jgi:hypothetical protein